MENSDLLVQRLADLCERKGTTPESGRKYVAEKAGVSEQYLYQIINNKPMSNGRSRSVGKVVRDKITAAFPEWLMLSNEPDDRLASMPMPPIEGSEEKQIQDNSALLPKLANHEQVAIPQLDLDFAMGGGRLPADFPEVLRTWDVPRAWLQEFVGKVNANDLCIATGVGDCFAPYYNNGDLLIIDRGYAGKPIRSSGIYAFQFDGLLYIKELRPIGTRHLEAYERGNGKAFDIDLAANNYMTIAKVLRAWRIE